MVGFLRGGLLFGGLAGSSAAIGVPAAYAIRKAAGGGASQISSPITNMSKCVTPTDGSFSVVNFGDSSAKEVCGTIAPPSGGPSIEVNDQKFSDLFKANWGNKFTSWSNLVSEGKDSNCTEGKGSFASKMSDAERLGLCTGKDINPSIQEGISVDNKNSLTPKVEVCKGSCFLTTGELGKDAKLDPTKKTGNGFTVSFKIKKS